MKRRSSRFDRLMIIGVFCLLAWPLLYWLFSPIEWRYASALELHKEGDIEKAKAAYEQILKSDPGHSLALFRLGELAYEEEKFEESSAYAERALEFAKSAQKPHIISLLTNSYASLGESEKAIEAVRQLRTYSTLPPNFDELKKDELAQFMTQPANRHILNSVAYVSAVADGDLQKAHRSVDGLIDYFETKEQLSLMAIPYLFERSSNYEQAVDALVNLANRIKGRVTNRQELENRIKTLKTELQKSSEPEYDVLAKQELKKFEKVAEHEMLYLIFTRLSLLATKLKSENADSFNDELQQYRSENINEESTLLVLDDAKFVEYAFELHHYYDTRAFIRLRMGEQLVSKSMDKDDDFLGFLRAMEFANELYELAYEDLMHAILLKNSMEAYLEKYPKNSLVISLPGDDKAKVERDKRIKAIEHYHRFLILNALGRIEEADIYKSKVIELGYQPNALLF